MQPTTDNRQPTTDTAAAIRHAVFRDLLDMLPIASYDQARLFASNLAICRAEIRAVPNGPGDGDRRERIINTAITRFLTLRVTPDIGETNTTRSVWLVPPDRYKEYTSGRIVPAMREALEYHFNHKYGDRLANVPGFYRRDENAPFRMNLPLNCAVYGYGNYYGPSRISPKFYTGILFQPLDRPDSFFLLSSAKFGGPKAVRLCPRDAQYFTQFEEVNV